jgi:hypothetical protein
MHNSCLLHACCSCVGGGEGRKEGGAACAYVLPGQLDCSLFLWVLDATLLCDTPIRKQGRCLSLQPCAPRTRKYTSIYLGSYAKANTQTLSSYSHRPVLCPARDLSSPASFIPSPSSGIHYVDIAYSGTLVSHRCQHSKSERLPRSSQPSSALLKQPRSVGKAFRYRLEAIIEDSHS